MIRRTNTNEYVYKTLYGEKFSIPQGQIRVRMGPVDEPRNRRWETMTEAQYNALEPTLTERKK